MTHKLSFTDEKLIQFIFFLLVLLKIFFKVPQCILIYNHSITNCSWLCSEDCTGNIHVQPL